MASIREIERKQGIAHQVLFFIETPKGRAQRSAGTLYDKSAAETLFQQIKHKEATGKLQIPNKITVEEFCQKYLSVIASEKSWSLSYYKAVKGHLKEHILPAFSRKKMQKINSIDISTFFSDLKKKKVMGAKFNNVPMEERPYLSVSTRQSVYVQLKMLFAIAVKWGIIEENPVKSDKPTNGVAKEANSWDDETAASALSSIESPLLHLAVHIALFTSSRIGEVSGILIEDFFPDTDDIRIAYTLQRVDKDDLEELKPEEIYKVFPNKASNSDSSLVLKATKTKVRKTCAISTVLKEEIVHRIQDIEKHKDLYGNRYQDNGLLFCHPDGTPIEPALMSKWFRKWNRKVGKKLGFPHLKFHELRHTSVSIYMDITNNNAKYVQSISGHSSAKMIFDRYQHTKDEKRVATNKMADKLSQELKFGGGEINNGSQVANENVLMSLIKLIKSDPLLQQKVVYELFNV